jgi:type I restriction enzyme, S subunit
LSRVPLDWNVTSLQRCVYVVEGQVDPEDEAYAAMALIAPNHVESGTGRLLSLESAVDQGAESGKYLCEAGDVVYSKIRPALRKVCIAPQQCLCSADMYPLRPGSGVLGPFLFWFLLSEEFSALAVLESQRVAMPKINRESLKVVPIILPSIQEQIAIAAFLDHETAKIDALVEEQKRLIELLKEKRQAVISQAVTKGLDPSVSMKDSGVEWLGEVPKHWVVRPLKHCVHLRSGGTPDKSRRDYWDGDVPWASAKDLKVDALFDTADHITEVAVSEGAATLLEPDAVLVVVRGMILARTFPVVTAKVSMAINQDLKAVSALAPGRNDWLAWLLRASSAETLSRLDEAGHGTKALRMDAWAGMRIAVPPPWEQESIAAFLATECVRLDDLMDEAAGAIGLLNERRAALISAAVTGKIDVRGFVPEPEPAAA